MAGRIAYTGGIVRDGLVLLLDAAKRDSYPGSGTTWRDLSGSGYVGTLYNGVSFSNSNNGILSFDGVDDYASIPINLTNTRYTIISAARYTGTVNRRIISSDTGNWLMGWWNGSVDQYYAEGWVSSVGGVPAETVWIIYAATGDYQNDSWSLYRNGSLIVSPNNGGSNGPSSIRVGGSGTFPSETSACEVSYISAYNRVLSATEITQNFNALRGRYGI